MAHLPPVTWNDIATKDDLDTLGMTLRAEMSTLHAEMVGQGSELRGEIARAMERQIRWMVTFNSALVALALTASRLLF